MEIFSPSGMILRPLVNKTSKIRIPNFSISFFSNVVQWYIEHYSTEETILLGQIVSEISVIVCAYPRVFP